MNFAHQPIDNVSNEIIRLRAASNLMEAKKALARSVYKKPAHDDDDSSSSSSDRSDWMEAKKLYAMAMRQKKEQDKAKKMLTELSFFEVEC